jgi:hypothetical protein
VAPFATPLAFTEDSFVSRYYMKNPARHRTGAMSTSENPLEAKFGELAFQALG